LTPMEEEEATWPDLEDPISTISDLNSEMLGRLGRIEFILSYSLWVGLCLSILSFIGIIVVSLAYQDAWYFIGLIIVFAFSFYTTWISLQERPFIYEYHTFVSSVQRGLDWDPEADIPEGRDEIDRLYKMLQEQDERVNKVYNSKNVKIYRDHTIEGESKKKYHFDGYLEGWVPGYNPFNEGVVIFIRKCPKVEQTDVDEYIAALNDIFKLSMEGRSKRFFFIQTEKPEFSEDIVEYVYENQIEYDRDARAYAWEWSSPIELIAEGSEGQYSIGTFSFG